MANNLKMDMVRTILALHKLRWSGRQIAQKLDIDRQTVARHLRLAASRLPTESNPANPPTGFGEQAKPATNLPAGSGEEPNPPAGSHQPKEGGRQCPLGQASCVTRADSTGPQVSELPPVCPNSTTCPWSRVNSVAESNPANPPAGSEEQSKPATDPPTGSNGLISDCEPYRQIIQAKLEQGLSAQRIWQDLVADHGFGSSYDSVKRFVRKLRAAVPLPFRRMECAPGQECQVDFGKGAPIVASGGRRRKSHAFRTVLGFSRKGYSEAVLRQTTDDFLLCLENAFWDWGGVPRITTIDNLRAAVKHPDWYDPELNPKVQSFCEHYGTVILPTKPYHPRHNGYVSWCTSLSLFGTTRRNCFFSTSRIPWLFSGPQASTGS